jgi:uncharacterized membrane protein YphA (DoxX/SURF4 family)
MSTINRFAPIITRLLLGALFLFSGINGLFQLSPPPELPPAAGAFMGALAATGYFFPLLKVTEIAVGVLLLINRFVPLALVVLAPIVVNIVAFHLVLAPSGIGILVLMVAAGVYLAWVHRDAYRPLLQARSSAAARPSLERGHSKPLAAQ